MDPITTAIVAALTALKTGAVDGLTETGKEAISDAYHALKGLLVRKSGTESDVARAISHLEAKPDSRGRQETLQEEITATDFSQDAEVLASAQRVLTLVQPQQAGMGKFTIQNNALVQGQVIGDHNTTSFINKTTRKTEKYVRQHPLTSGIILLVILLTLSLGAARVVPPLVSHRANVPTPTPSSGPMSKPPRIVGTWTGCQMVGFNQAVFNSDGTVDLDNNVETYTFYGTQVEFSNTPNNTGTVEYADLFSPSGNVLTLTDTKGNFCVMARSGSSGIQEILSSILGTWTGNCEFYNNGGPYNVQFQQIDFLNDGTFTLAQGNSVSGPVSGGTYTIPYEMQISDYTYAGLSFGSGGNTPFFWLVSTDGGTKTLALTELGGYSCSLTGS